MTQTAYADEETGTETKQEIVYGDDVAYDPNTGHSYEFVNTFLLREFPAGYIKLLDHVVVCPVYNLPDIQQVCI